MNAGMVRGRVKSGHLDEVIEIYRSEVFPAVSKVPGCKGAQLWINSELGECISIGTYDSAESRAAAGPVVSDLLAKLDPHLEGPRPQREMYDLAASTAQEARALVRRSMDAFNKGDLEQVARDLAPDVVLTAPGGIERRGPQAVKEFDQNWRNAFPDGQFSVSNIFAHGDTVVVEGGFSGTHAGTLAAPMGDIPATGRKVSESFVQICTIDRGLISRIRQVFDQMSLMKQLGVAPSVTGASTTT